MRIWTVVPASIGTPEYCSPPASEKIPHMKWWGWGREEDQPPVEVGAAARAHLGFGEAEVEEPVRLEDVELRAPRIEPPQSLAGICSTDKHERVSHSYGK